MFRDDLRAAVDHAEEAERDLAEALRRAEAAERELEELRGKLHVAERELELLRPQEGPMRDGPSGPRRRAVLLIGILAFALLAAGGGGALLLVSSTQQSMKPNAPTVEVESSDSFEGTVRRVRRDCQVTTSGYLSKCKPKSLPRELRLAEERVGAQSAAMTYCKLLDTGERKLRAIAAKRLGGFYSERLEDLDRRIFSCLDRYVRRSGAHRHHVAYVWAKLGSRLGHSEPIVRYLRTAPKDVRADGLKGIWSHQRLQALPELRRYLESGDEQQVQTALQALTNVRGDAERAAVCPLVAGVITRHATHQHTAARATFRLALICSRSHTKHVVDNVERAYANRAYRKQGFDYWWIAALGSCTGGDAKPSAQERQRAIALTSGLINDEELPAARRSQALRALATIDLATGRGLAQRLDKDSPAALREEAKRLLASSASPRAIGSIRPISASK